MAYKIDDKVVFIEKKALLYDKAIGKVYEVTKNVKFNKENSIKIKRNGIERKAVFFETIFRLATQEEVIKDNIKMIFEPGNV